VRIIDAHVHLYPPATSREPAAWAAAQGERHWAELCTRRRKNGRAVQGFPSVDELLRAMDAAGVEKSVLLGWYWERPETCAAQNRFYAECVRAHPARLAAFATVHPAAGAEALTEVWRARGDGLIGLGELSPHSQHVAPEDETWGEILELAGELGLPVNLHVSLPAGRPYPGRVDTPLEDFLALAQRHPRTKFILAHWGGGLAADAGRPRLDNIWYDTAASPLLHGPEIWREAVAVAGADRVLFGSDFPLLLYPARETQPAVEGLLAEARSGLAEAERPAVLGGTAAKLLGL